MIVLDDRKLGRGLSKLIMINSGVRNTLKLKPIEQLIWPEKMG